MKRRDLFRILAGAGAGALVFTRAVQVLAANRPKVTEGMLRNAEWISGVHFSDQERKLMLGGVDELLQAFEELRAVQLDNAVTPAIVFQPEPSPIDSIAADRGEVQPSERAPAAFPGNDEEILFSPVTELSAWIRNGELLSTELTQLYLRRLERLNPKLECAIRLTEELAMEQANHADREIASGRYRGPLHGIPWGAKDLLAVPDYPTTWGATPYREQVIGRRATVASRLDRSGAVLIAKLSLGALAWGDVWFGGTTRNPWKLDQGSSGSSAGSASATAAGCVGFAIGSETWGSIVSPCTRCGATGLRPTFGRVSRYGAMALAWSMDKLGPIARSVEDCALVFAAIEGADGRDPSAVSRPFQWPLQRDPRTLRVGYIPELFDEDRGEGVEDEERRERARESQRFDRRTLDELKHLGFRMVPFRLPDKIPVGSLSFILTAEASAAFDELTRSGQDDELVRQVEQAWPNVFRQGQLIPAVEYIRANRIRSMLMQQMSEAMRDVDLYVCPSFGGDNLLLTNLTGHPAVVLPNGFRSGDGTPTSITFNGQLFGESELLAVAHAYQQGTRYHLERPDLDG